MSEELLTKARAVIARWDSPLWKDLPATGNYINELRQAVVRAEADQQRQADTVQELRAEVARLSAELGEQREKLAEMEKQEPVGEFIDDQGFLSMNRVLPKGGKLYARPSPAEPVNARLLEELRACRDRFFPAGQQERDRDLQWDAVNGAIAAAEAQAPRPTPCQGHAAQQEADELFGLRGCNSRHGGVRNESPCIYRMRSTDTGCTGCSDRGDDHAR